MTTLRRFTPQRTDCTFDENTYKARNAHDHAKNNNKEHIEHEGIKYLNTIMVETLGPHCSQKKIQNKVKSADISQTFAVIIINSEKP